MEIRMNVIEDRRKFIQNMESNLYAGKNGDGDEVQIRLQKGVGMEVWTRRKEKPRWWEVVTFDDQGFQVSETYEPYEE